MSPQKDGFVLILCDLGHRLMSTFTTAAPRCIITTYTDVKTRFVAYRTLCLALDRVIRTINQFTFALIVNKLLTNICWTEYT